MTDSPSLSRLVLVNLSVRVLQAAAVRAQQGCVDGAEVRLALRCLLPHCRERSPLLDFWDAARQLHHAARADNCGTALTAIVADLERSGLHPGFEVAARRQFAEAIREAGADQYRINDAKRRHDFSPPRSKRQR